jgi:VTC domain
MIASADLATFRYERKFRILELSRSQVEAIVRVNSAHFSEIFESRWINNVYLDTWSMSSYHENLMGCSHDRIKYRIRWYGELLGSVAKPVLELKIKHGEVNRKVSYPLAPIAIPKVLSSSQIRDLLANCEAPASLRGELLKLKPILVNRYQRNYFLSEDRQFRLTIDSDIEFYDASRDGCSMRFHQADRAAVVLELKYPVEAAPQANRISQQFPFRMTRSSKYISGVERVYYTSGFNQL